jgi:hypothetical protein
VGPPFVPSKTTLVAGAGARGEARKGITETIAPATKARREIVKAKSSASHDKLFHSSVAMSNVRFLTPDLRSAHLAGAPSSEDKPRNRRLDAENQQSKVARMAGLPKQRCARAFSGSRYPVHNHQDCAVCAEICKQPLLSPFPPEHSLVQVEMML